METIIFIYKRIKGSLTRPNRLLAFSFIGLCLLAAGCSSDGSTEDRVRTAPAVELTGLNQEMLYTSEVEKPMVVSFWASWCQYCKKELPILDSLYEEYKDQVEFVSVNITYDDNLSGVKSFVDKHQLRMPVYLDLDGIASRSFRVLGVPSIVTVDKSGAIVEQLTGALGEQAEKLYRMQLDTLLSTAQ